jgi:O-antigen/teichoic acid export membrane protein
VKVSLSLLPKQDYAEFTSMQMAYAQLGIPFAGMQTAFAYLSAQAAATNDRQHLSGALRGLLKVMFSFWCVAALLCFCFRDRLVLSYSLTSPLIIWFTLGVASIMCAVQAVFGVLQGEQRFVHLSVATVVSSASQMVGLTTFLAVIKRTPAGGMAGLCLGALLTLGFTLFLTRKDWQHPPAPFDLLAFIRRFLPLTLGFGVTTFMFTEDVLIVQRYLNEGANGYSAAKVVGRSIFFLTGPLVWVMFPKIVSSVAKAEETKVLGQALGVTLLVCGGVALASSFLPALPLRILSGDKYLDSAQMVPWFAWALLPMVLANLLITNLLARERFAVVPTLVTIAAVYGITLRWYHPSHQAVIVTLACFSSLLLLVSWIYTVRESKRASAK